jgi:hypothetical protein
MPASLLSGVVVLDAGRIRAELPGERPGPPVLHVLHLISAG